MGENMNLKVGLKCVLKPKTAAAVQSEINVAFPCLGETGPDTCKEKLRYTHFKGHIKLQHTATYNKDKTIYYAYNIYIYTYMVLSTMKCLP